MRPGGGPLEGTSAALWTRVSGFIADRMGLHFPPERVADLQRGLAAAARDFGFSSVPAFGEWLLQGSLTKGQLQELASHLTVGETYFFREPKTFDALAGRVLPDLIDNRRGREQRLRLWSAACCTGEEAYSLAILVRQLLPDLPDWHVTILATDINPRFLRTAMAGTYGGWSFRGAPPGFKERYFSRTADGRYAIDERVKAMVTFEHLNLVEDGYPSLATDTNAMDVIFCRNVLMYFTPPQTQKVVGRLHHALVEGGWLVVSPTEASNALSPHFEPRNFPGAILHQKGGAASAAPAISTPSGPRAAREPIAPRRVRGAPAAVPHTAPAAAPAWPAAYAAATSHYEQGRYAEAAETLMRAAAGRAPDPRGLSLLVRALANEGRLAEALTWCDRWIAAEKLNAAAHYLRAMLALELERASDDARQSLRRAIFLDPDFALAHFALGTLARTAGQAAEADRHFANTLRLLARLAPDEVLPESDGLTAGRLAETITALTTEGSAS